MTGRATTVATFVALLLVLAAACGDDGADPTPHLDSTVDTPLARRRPRPLARTNARPERGTTRARPHRSRRRYRGLPPDAPRLARDAPYRIPGRRQRRVLHPRPDRAVRANSHSNRAAHHRPRILLRGGRSLFLTGGDRADRRQISRASCTRRCGRSSAANGRPAWTPIRASRIFHASLEGVGGYFSGGDEFPAAVAPRSNEREVLYVDSENPWVAGRRLQRSDRPRASAHGALACGRQRGLVGERGPLAGRGEEVGRRPRLAGATFLSEPDTQLTFWPEYEIGRDPLRGRRALHGLSARPLRRP